MFILIKNTYYLNPVTNLIVFLKTINGKCTSSILVDDPMVAIPRPINGIFFMRLLYGVKKFIVGFKVFLTH